MDFQTVRGMRDFLPEQARKKKFIESVCRRVFESYGFQPIETPVIEELALLAKKGSAGEEIEKEIYSFKDKGDRDLGLRFDLTVPLARVAASNSQLRMPFKRYQIERVYRYDRPQAKRYREFTQADIDILGSESMLAEFECIAIASEICQKLGLEFSIAINSRKLLEQAAAYCGVQKEKIADCFRIIDKLEKIGEDGVKKELKETGIDAKILGLIKEKNLKKIEELLVEKNLDLEGLNDLETLMDLLKREKLDKFVELDLSLARGLAYYTGTVFEVRVKEGPSIGGGGRYDELIGLYGNRKIPAVGISFGIDRILDTIEEKLEVPKETRVLVCYLNEKFQMNALNLAQELRRQGIGTELDLMDRNISKNLEYANKAGIELVALIGEKEAEKNSFTVKNMKTGEQKTLKISEAGKILSAFEAEKPEKKKGTKAKKARK